MTSLPWKPRRRDHCRVDAAALVVGDVDVRPVDRRSEARGARREHHGRAGVAQLLAVGGQLDAELAGQVGRAEDQRLEARRVAAAMAGAARIPAAVSVTASSRTRPGSAPPARSRRVEPLGDVAHVVRPVDHGHHDEIEPRQRRRRARRGRRPAGPDATPFTRTATRAAGGRAGDGLDDRAAGGRPSPRAPRRPRGRGRRPTPPAASALRRLAGVVAGREQQRAQRRRPSGLRSDVSVSGAAVATSRRTRSAAPRRYRPSRPWRAALGPKRVTSSRRQASARARPPAAPAVGQLQHRPADHADHGPVERRPLQAGEAAVDGAAPRRARSPRRRRRRPPAPRRCGRPRAPRPSASARAATSSRRRRSAAGSCVGRSSTGSSPTVSAAPRKAGVPLISGPCRPWRSRERRAARAAARTSAGEGAQAAALQHAQRHRGSTPRRGAPAPAASGPRCSGRTVLERPVARRARVGEAVAGQPGEGDDRTPEADAAPRARQGRGGRAGRTMRAASAACRRLGVADHQRAPSRSDARAQRRRGVDGLGVDRRGRDRAPPAPRGRAARPAGSRARRSARAPALVEHHRAASTPRPARGQRVEARGARTDQRRRAAEPVEQYEHDRKTAVRAHAGTEAYPRPRRTPRDARARLDFAIVRPKTPRPQATPGGRREGSQVPRVRSGSTSCGWRTCQSRRRVPARSRSASAPAR